MDQGKTMPFSVIKQKIIKTDEVLRMYIDVSNKLKKAQQACKEIKFQYDQLVTDSSRIKLEHERCTFNIDNLKQRNNILDKDNKELLEQKLLLEEKYNQQTVQSQLSIKHLQDELQMLNDISTAAENCAPKRKRNSPKISKNRIENGGKNISTIIENQSVGVLNGKYPNVNNLLVANDSLFRKQNQCDPQVESGKYQTLNEIINDEHAITFDNTIENKSNDEKMDENNCRCTQDIGTQTHTSEIERRSVYTQTLETIKHLDTFLSENQQLKQRICECDKEILKLQAKQKVVKVSCSIQTEEMEIDDGFVEYILKDMIIPNVLSPIVDSPKATNVYNSTPPEVIAIPPISTKKSIEANFTPSEQECNKNTTLDTNGNNLQKSSRKNDKVCTRNSRHSSRYKYKFPVVNNDINSFVKLRRKCLRRLTKKKYILNKEIRKMRKLRKQDYLLETLCTLKQLNINFTISNDSSSPKLCSSKEENIQEFNYPYSNPTSIQKSKPYLTQQLNCICTKCNQASMLLNEVGNEMHLLGFYRVKNEVDTPTNSRMENNWDTKSSDPLQLFNSSVNESNNVAENVLERLAEIVSGKLREREKDRSKSRNISTDHDNIFYSETEPEIERLFDKTSNIDILKGNKMLSKTAKKECQMPELSSVGNLDLEQDYSSKEIDVFFDPHFNLLNDTVDSEMGDCIIPGVPIDDVCAENSDHFNFKLPSCPQLISPIKSVKNVSILKTTQQVSELHTSDDSSDFICTNRPQKCQNLVESIGILCNNVQDRCNNLNSIKLFDEVSNKEDRQISYTILGTKEDGCAKDTNEISADHIYSEGDTNNVLNDTDIYEQNVNFGETEYIENYCENIPVNTDNRITEDEKPIPVNEIQQSASTFVKSIKMEEINTTSLKDYSVYTANEPNGVSICAESPIPDNINVFYVTNDKNDSDDVPICPESPIPDYINVCLKSPILIPLEKLNIEEDTKNSEVCQKIDKHLSSPPSNDLAPAPQKIRRSKRIFQKRCSILEKRTSDFNKMKNNTLSQKSETPECLHLNAGPRTLPHDNNLLKVPLLGESLKNIVAQSNTNLVGEQAANLNIGHEDDGKRTTVTSGARKRVSKLKSKILREVRVKRQMFKTSTDCSMSKINENRPTVTNSKPSTQDNRNVNKIHIVQNILIPANSSYAIDLLKESEYKTVGSAAENCDIKLVNEQSSSQCSTAVPNCSTENKFSSNIGNIPNKKRRVGCKKMKNDLLSMIIKEMDKDRPEIILKEKKEFISAEETVPDSTDEKQWRKGVLVIADNIHNISSKSFEPKRNINQDRVFIPTSKLTLKRKILLSRLSKLSNEEKIPDEIILEFKRQDVNSIAELILQKVSQDIWDKPEDKYYPAPLMTKTQRILLELMVRLEQEKMENVMDTFICKVESLLFKVGCGIRALIPIVRLYMAVCKLRRDIDQMRNFCCDAFLFMDNMAVPLFFTILTSWTEVIPMEPDIKNYPLAKVLIQVVHLKICKKPGYNLLPLKFLLNQFYGYPKERWDCDEVFKELFQQYLESPDKSSDMALRLLCKHKDSKWVYKKVNEFFKPLIYKIPSENVNFRATVIILLANMCTHFNPNNEFDKCSLDELRRWLIGLTEGEDVHNLITNSVNLSMSKLPTKKTKPKYTKVNCTKVRNIPKKNKGKKRKKKKNAIVK